MSEPPRDDTARRDSGQAPDQRVSVEPASVEPIRIDTAPIVVVGTLAWLVALIVTLVVPALHSADRDWWPWACVSGLALGMIGLGYVLRGRGNAVGAR